jgi:hypothetical protein
MKLIINKNKNGTFITIEKSNCVPLKAYELKDLYEKEGFKKHLNGILDKIKSENNVQIIDYIAL